MSPWLGHATSRSFEGGLSQIITKNLIAGMTLEVITDQGLLSNPYRSIRFVDASVPLGYSLGTQIYPNTHTSTAVETRAKYYLPYRSRRVAVLPVFQRHLGHSGQHH